MVALIIGQSTPPELNVMATALFASAREGVSWSLLIAACSTDGVLPTYCMLLNPCMALVRTATAGYAHATQAPPHSLTQVTTRSWRRCWRAAQTRMQRTSPGCRRWPRRRARVISRRWMRSFAPARFPTTRPTPANRRERRRRRRTRRTTPSALSRHDGMLMWSGRCGGCVRRVCIAFFLLLASFASPFFGRNILQRDAWHHTNNFIIPSPCPCVFPTTPVSTVSASHRCRPGSRGGGEASARVPVGGPRPPLRADDGAGRGGTRGYFEERGRWGGVWHARVFEERGGGCVIWHAGRPRGIWGGGGVHLWVACHVSTEGGEKMVLTGELDGPLFRSWVPGLTL